MSDNFIHELFLPTLPAMDRILGVKLEKARELYNVCLGESFKRLNRMRASSVWKEAYACKDPKMRRKLFAEANKQVGFSEYALHTYVKEPLYGCSIGDHIDSQVAQVIASKAFRAVAEYALGKKGKPRFKGKGQYTSIEGKSNKTGIRFKKGKLYWQGMEILPRYDLADQHGVQAYALSCHIKYCRLVRRKERGEYKWYLQLILDGKPCIKKKNKIGEQASVGLDIGPSSIAIVGEREAHLLPFCPKIELKEKEIRILRRKIDRSKRALNPDNYHEKGEPKRKAKWVISKRSQKDCNRIQELLRQQGAARKTSHGTLSNKIIEISAVIKTEKLSYKSFQKNFGRSVSRNAPGMFIQILRRKAENAGGKVIEFSCYRTKLSQTCQCTDVKKKPLSERWHACRCGVVAQRDLYSAFLARHVKDDTLNHTQAEKAWASAEPILEQAWLSCKEMASGGRKLSSFGLSQRQSHWPAQGRSMQDEVVVGR